MRIITIILILILSRTYCQERTVVSANRINEKVEVNGELAEAFWKNAQVVSDFIQNTPIAGDPSIQKTEVKIAFDNNAIYVGAVMYDDRDSMSTTLSQRDDFGNADWFGVIFDPYNAGTIGFAFLVTSAGVQIDELHNVENVDGNWNAVWKSAIQIHKDRWVAEIRIPFSALRFSKNGKNDWGVNFARNIRRNREQSYWNDYSPAGLNLISQLGVVKGIKKIDSPLRLALPPYVSGYIENFDGSTGYSANGGMDVKWGVNEAFTIDMAYRWVFAPGSELSLVWKNSIFSFSDEVEKNYLKNLEDVVNSPATNSLSLKILYYIDYGAFHQKVFKKRK